MLTPEIGQVVRIPDYDEKLVVKSLSADESAVELTTVEGDPRGKSAVADLLPGEDLSAG